MKCVYLAVMSLDPTGKGRQRWTNRWKPALNASTIAFPNPIMAVGKQPRYLPMVRTGYTVNATLPRLAGR